MAHGWVAAGGDDLEAAGCIDRLGPGEARGRGGKSRDPAGSDGEGGRGPVVHRSSGHSLGTCGLGTMQVCTDVSLTCPHLRGL